MRKFKRNGDSSHEFYEDINMNRSCHQIKYEITGRFAYETTRIH